jgi:hypothetical protein
MRPSNVDDYSLYLSIHEVNLHDFSRITIFLGFRSDCEFKNDLVPLRTALRTKVDAPTNRCSNGVFDRVEYRNRRVRP